MNPKILKEAEKYRTFIYSAAQNSGIFKPSLIAGLICEESRFGLILNPPGPTGVGDKGHGHGLMQIDDRTWEFARTGNWQDPLENIMFGVGILKSNYEFFKAKDTIALFQILPATLAAYNCGPLRALKGLIKWGDPDYYTSKDEGSGPHGDYSKDVIKNALYFFEHGWI